MNNNLTLLKFFIENKDSVFTIKKVSEVLKINYRIVYEEIMDLGKEGLINIVKRGNSKLCSFNYAYSSKIVEIEKIRMQELFKDKNIKLIYHRIKEIRSPFYCLVLFGSFASKKNQKGSDVDLCLITDSGDIEKKINDILSITPINVHLQVFTSEMFIQMLERKGFNVGNEILKNNIILYGIEAFYEMVNNVSR